MARALRSIDVTRLAQAVQRPGADPRAWVAFGAVEEIVFDPESGITVGVTFRGGPLDGEGPIACALAAPFARALAIGAKPFAVGDQAVVILPDGDPNTFPIIVGFFPLQLQVPPLTAAGLPLTQSVLEGNHVLADPTKGAIWDVASFQVFAPQVKLGPAPAPTQSYVRGQDLIAALGDLATALNSYATALVPPGPPVTPVTAAQTAPALATLTAALTAFSAKLALTLSPFIKGE